MELKDAYTVSALSFIDMFIPIGSVLPYSGVGSPNECWGECNGQTLLIEDYPNVYDYLINTSAIRTVSGQPTSVDLFTIYGGNLSEGYLRLPDYRECAIAGYGPQVGAAADNREWGEFTNDQFQTHTHNSRIARLKDQSGSGWKYAMDNDYSGKWQSNEIRVEGNSTGRRSDDWTFGATRGKRKGVTYIMRIK